MAPGRKRSTDQGGGGLRKSRRISVSKSAGQTARKQPPESQSAAEPVRRSTRSSNQPFQGQAAAEPVRRSTRSSNQPFQGQAAAEPVRRSTRSSNQSFQGHAAAAVQGLRRSSRSSTKSSQGQPAAPAQLPRPKLMPTTRATRKQILQAQPTARATLRSRVPRSPIGPTAEDRHHRFLQAERADIAAAESADEDMPDADNRHSSSGGSTAYETAPEDNRSVGGLSKAQENYNDSCSEQDGEYELDQDYQQVEEGEEEEEHEEEDKQAEKKKDAEKKKKAQKKKQDGLERRKTARLGRPVVFGPERTTYMDFVDDMAKKDPGHVARTKAGRGHKARTWYEIDFSKFIKELFEKRPHVNANQPKACDRCACQGKTCKHDGKNACHFCLKAKDQRYPCTITNRQTLHVTRYYRSDEERQKWEAILSAEAGEYEEDSDAEEDPEYEEIMKTLRLPDQKDFFRKNVLELSGEQVLERIEGLQNYGKDMMYCVEHLEDHIQLLLEENKRLQADDAPSEPESDIAPEPEEPSVPLPLAFAQCPYNPLPPRKQSQLGQISLSQTATGPFTWKMPSPPPVIRKRPGPRPTKAPGRPLAPRPICAPRPIPETAPTQPPQEPQPRTWAPRPQYAPWLEEIVLEAERVNNLREKRAAFRPVLVYKAIKDKAALLTSPDPEGNIVPYPDPTALLRAMPISKPHRKSKYQHPCDWCKVRNMACKADKDLACRDCERTPSRQCKVTDRYTLVTTVRPRKDQADGSEPNATASTGRLAAIAPRPPAHAVDAPTGSINPHPAPTFGFQDPSVPHGFYPAAAGPSYPYFAGPHRNPTHHGQPNVTGWGSTTDNLLDPSRVLRAAVSNSQPYAAAAPALTSAASMNNNPHDPVGLALYDGLTSQFEDHMTTWQKPSEDAPNDPNAMDAMDES